MSNNGTELKRSAKKAPKKREKKLPKTMESVRIKNRYFRRFFYAFASFFIVFGLIGILWFVYEQDPDIFGSSEKYYILGNEALEKNDLKEALESYEKCLEIDPGKNEARLQAVKIYRRQGNYKKAEALLNEGLSLQPRYEEYYRQMVYLLVDQNRISEALDYLEGITTTYIVVKLNEERPSAISAFPQPGIYSSPQQVTLNVPENTTIYYTLDGTAPDLDSSKYVSGQTISVGTEGTTNLRAVAISELGMPSIEYDVTYRYYNENTEYVFKDAKIEKLVRLMIGRSEGKVYYKDLEGISSLDLTLVDGSVVNLEDLPEMPHLEKLVLDGETAIVTFRPLRRMTELRTLSLDGCTLTDEEFADVAAVLWLTELSVENNALTTLAPAASMMALTSLDASGNRIKSMPALTRLSALKELDVSSNHLSSLSWISGHKTLNVLNLSHNMLEDVSDLSTCSALRELDVSSNHLSSLAPLAACTRLETLNVSGNLLTGLTEISSLSSLSNLDASSNAQLSSVACLRALPSLTSLNVSETKVTDFDSLQGSGLKNLYASNCGLSDLSPFISLGLLEFLDVSGNVINNISAVALMAKLSVLNVSNNYVSDFNALLNCDRLTSVNCKGCGMSASIAEKLAAKGIVVIN